MRDDDPRWISALMEGGSVLDHPLWFLIFLIVAAVGMLFQLQMNRGHGIERYNRWETSVGGIRATPH
jgi:hypothetical protein